MSNAKRDLGIDRRRSSCGMGCATSAAAAIEVAAQRGVTPQLAEPLRAEQAARLAVTTEVVAQAPLRAP